MTQISGTTLLQKAAVFINFELVRVMVESLVQTWTERDRHQFLTGQSAKISCKDSMKPRTILHFLQYLTPTPPHGH